MITYSWEDINAFVASELQPYVESHQGIIKVISISAANDVVIELSGACASCPYIFMTTQYGIKGRLKDKFPHLSSITVNYGNT